MNKLHTFGCSFTEDFEPFMECPETTRYKYVMDYHNGIIPNNVGSIRYGVKKLRRNWWIF